MLRWWPAFYTGRSSSRTSAQLSQQELASRLQDYLFYLSEQSGENVFPKPAVHYLDDWSSDEHGWLRKYYPPDSDEPHYGITSATEKAIDWLISLGQRQFIGAESRLKTISALLLEMTEGTEIDPTTRITELEKRKAQIEADIQQIREGRISLLDATQVKSDFYRWPAWLGDCLLISASWSRTFANWIAPSASALPLGKKGKERYWRNSLENGATLPLVIFNRQVQRFATVH
jgi:hypothetical protein